MPNSETIPSGSAITEAMISLYLALNPSSNRSAAIAALHNIETGVTVPTSAQRTNPVYSALISSYDQNVAGLGEGGRIISPADENDVNVAGPSGTGKWTPLGALLATIGTIAAMVITSLTVTTLTATNQVSTNSTSTNAYVQSFVSPSVASLATIQMASGTSTACSVLNTDATGTRVILNTWLVQSTGTSIGDVFYTVGTSTGAATTSTSPFIQTVLSRVASGRNLITTTSTQTGTSTWSPLFPVLAPWHAGEYVTAVSVTTVNAGTCFVQYK